MLTIPVTYIKTKPILTGVDLQALIFNFFSECSEKVFSKDGDLFILSDLPVNYEDAEKICHNSLGGIIVSINVENNQRQFFNNLQLFYIKGKTSWITAKSLLVKEKFLNKDF